MGKAKYQGFFKATETPYFPHYVAIFGQATDKAAKITENFASRWDHLGFMVDHWDTLENSRRNHGGFSIEFPPNAYVLRG